MKPLPSAAQKRRPEPSQSLIEQRVREAFARLPLLLAITFDKNLSLADVEVQPCPGCDWAEEVYIDVDAEISALVDELKRAGATELLRGRTFARTVH
ncbi:MAG TPA: hypothetical protein VFJ70_03250 [Burkholderiales bacterium]|nr:hypothetical protein [Burkholderiales bacterium]